MSRAEQRAEAERIIRAQLVDALELDGGGTYTIARAHSSLAPYAHPPAWASVRECHLAERAGATAIAMSDTPDPWEPPGVGQSLGRGA